MSITNSVESSGFSKRKYKVLGIIFLPIGLILLIIGITNFISASKVVIPSIFETSFEEVTAATDLRFRLFSTGGIFLFFGLTFIAVGGVLLYYKRIHSYYGGGEFSPSARLKQRAMPSEGTNFLEESSRKDKNKIQCNACNALNDREKLFCTFCGTKL